MLELEVLPEWELAADCAGYADYKTSLVRVTQIPAQRGRVQSTRSVSLPGMGKLAWLFLIDAILLLLSGFLLGGWSNSSTGIDLLGLPIPGGYETHLADWRANGMAGEFGGALIAFGFATLAIAVAKDSGTRRTAVPFYLAGHFFLSFMVLGKTMAFGATPGGLALTAVAIYPGIAFFYALFNGHSALWIEVPGSASHEEQKIREAVGQQERNRLAQDLHDSVKQQVYAIQTNLATAQARWTADASGAREAVDRARSTAHEAMTEMIALLDRLRRDPVETLGFVEAVRRQAEALQFQSGAEVHTSFGEIPTPDRASPGAMNAAFRIAQEAMANIARHARATHVRVRAGIEGDPNAFMMSIADDGHGFDPSSAANGMGLANIRERAEEIGAGVQIQSEPGHGCTVKFSVGLIDPLNVSMSRQTTSFFVSLLILVPTAVLAWYWTEARPFLVPLVVLAGLFAFYHAVAAGLTKWRAR
jgi:signal transduction histidine kinase